MTTASPPMWAERMLCLVLALEDRETITGDLLEHYRARVRPSRGPAGADRWYVRQVAWFVWRATRVWAVVLSAGFVGRDVLDMLAPTTDFHLRASVSTAATASVLVASAVWASWRAQAAASGVLAGVMTTMIAGVFSLAGVAGLLAVWHDQKTLAAIAASGGLSEAFSLPLTLVVAGALLGAAGGLLGRTARRVVAGRRC